MNGSIVLRDGWVVDGSGAPGRTADVVLAGDRIVDIALPGQGRGASGSEVIDLIHLISARIDSPLAEATLTVPSSSMLISAPVSATISSVISTAAAFSSTLWTCPAARAGTR